VSHLHLLPFTYIRTTSPPCHHSHIAPLKMELTLDSETSAFKTQTPGNNPEDCILLTFDSVITRFYCIKKLLVIHSVLDRKWMWETEGRGERGNMWSWKYGRTVSLYIYIYTHTHIRKHLAFTQTYKTICLHLWMLVDVRLKLRYESWEPTQKIWIWKEWFD
jgi:hypothetical protein